MTATPLRRLTVLAVGITTLFVLGAGTAAEQPRSAVPANPDERTILHVLNRLGFGPAGGDVAAVRRIGLAAYIDRQLHPDRIDDSDTAVRLKPFETLRMSTRELAEDYFVPAMMERRRQQQQQQQQQPQRREAPGGGEPEGTDAPAREMRTPAQIEAMRAERTVLAELAQQKVIRAVYSERQLEEVLVDFWFNHFNVFAGKGLTRVYLTEYERDAIRPHVLGTFRDLLGATAHSPAMLFYLDNWQSSAPMPEPSARPARQPRRGGLAGGRIAEMRQQAQNRRPRGLNENYARELMELHTLGVDGGYTQKDVQEVARAFTGWTIDAPRGGGGFRFEPRMHDDGEKVVLGHRLAAGGGKKDGDRILDILAAHPSTARHIATKLARRFVADEPPPALVDRVAARFRETKGDLREVVRAIVTSPEFFADSAYRAKVKTPFEFAVSALRAADVDMRTALPVVASLRELGMPLYGSQPPTGYADRADAWVNTGALLNRMNFAVSLTEGRLRGLQPGVVAAAADPSQVRAALLAGVLGGDVSDSTQTTVARATTAAQTAALILGSPEFQKR